MEEVGVAQRLRGKEGGVLVDSENQAARRAGGDDTARRDARVRHEHPFQAKL